jgi:hypothetical protein
LAIEIDPRAICSQNTEFHDDVERMMIAGWRQIPKRTVTMTITVLHMRRIDTLTQMAMTARIARNDPSPDLTEMRLREKVRRPSLGWSAEEIEALSGDPARTRLYFRRLALMQRSAARLLYEAGGYEAVATIDAPDLRTAYDLTSCHPDRMDWTQGNDPRVTVLPAARPFDSGVGDLFRDEATGDIHLCMAEGYENLGPMNLTEAAWGGPHRGGERLPFLRHTTTNPTGRLRTERLKSRNDRTAKKAALPGSPRKTRPMHPTRQSLSDQRRNANRVPKGERLGARKGSRSSSA